MTYYRGIKQTSENTAKEKKFESRYLQRSQARTHPIQVPTRPMVFTRGVSWTR